MRVCKGGRCRAGLRSPHGRQHRGHSLSPPSPMEGPRAGLGPRPSPCVREEPHAAPGPLPLGRAAICPSLFARSQGSSAGLWNSIHTGSHSHAGSSAILSSEVRPAQMHHCAENLITLPHGHLEWKASDRFPLGLSVPVAEQHLSERRAPGIREADAELSSSLPRGAPGLCGHRPVLAPLQPQESPGPWQGGWRRVPKSPVHPESPHPHAPIFVLGPKATFVLSPHGSCDLGGQDLPGRAKKQ